MEPIEGVGVKIDDASLQHIEPSVCPSSPRATVPPVSCKKRRVAAKGVQNTLSKTSMLMNFLPTATLLTFEMVLPTAYGKGQCSTASTLMVNALLGICTLCCSFFHFTDSFRGGQDGKLHYGFVTPRGLAVFKPGLGVELPKDESYKVSFTDFFHAIRSGMVVMAVALSDYRATNCLLPGHTKEMDEIMGSFPLMVGIV